MLYRVQELEVGQSDDAESNGDGLDRSSARCLCHRPQGIQPRSTAATVAREAAPAPGHDCHFIAVFCDSCSADRAVLSCLCFFAALLSVPCCLSLFLSFWTCMHGRETPEFASEISQQKAVLATLRMGEREGVEWTLTKAC